MERQVDFYTHMVGLGETERDDAGRVYLRCNTNHHAVVLVPSTETGIDHFALDAGSQAELEAAANALARAGIAYETVGAGEAGQGEALRLRDPDGYVVELIASDSTGELDGIVYAEERISYLPPVVRPGKVICLGLNYRAHAAEAGMAVPDYPVLFHKVAGSLIGHNQPIIAPRISDKIDYEGELAVIVGRRGKYIAEQDALAYVAGYCVANDVSARDLQFRTSQWTSGKMLDTFGPLGPALVTKDEEPVPHALAIRTILNGQVMQDASTADMIFRVPYIISSISEIVILEAGDVIMTGTPPGIGNTRKPQVFMKPGDTVTVEIERLGRLTNALVGEG